MNWHYIHRFGSSRSIGTSSGRHAPGARRPHRRSRIAAPALAALTAALSAALVAGAADARPAHAPGAGDLGSGAAAKAPRHLVVHPAQGEVLPVRTRRVRVAVACRRAKRPCRGRIEVAARGRKARRSLGKRIIAERTFTLAARSSDRIPLRLSSRARRALRRHPVVRTRARLEAKGQRDHVHVGGMLRATSDRLVLADGTPERIEAHPATGGEPRSVTFYWDWTIPARKALVVPDFKCPSGAPYVATNGTVVARDPDTRVSWGLKAKLVEKANTGTGYNGFHFPHLDRASGYWIMTGWPQGNWLFNSIWAGLIEDGHFELAATCTDSTDKQDIAWIDNEIQPDGGRYDGSGYLFPWYW